jgi:hypothetical protein
VNQDTRIIRAMAIALTALIAMQILASGYMPVDDALRHAAKAVARKPWSEIVLMKPGALDFSPGWHAFLTGVHRLTGANVHTLVWIEVILLFVLFWLGPLLLLARPEAWLVAISIGALLEPQLEMRLIIGRPLVLPMAILVTMCLLWRRLDTEVLSRRAFAVAVLLVAIAVWVHGSWYLWALPVFACLLAGHRRVAVRFAAATAIGVAIGALATLHPVQFLWQHLGLALNVGGGGLGGWVYEMKPYPFFPMLTLTVPLIVIVRRIWRGAPAHELLRDPVFILAALGFILGLKSARFWMDWGMPALVVFLALEVQALLDAQSPGRARVLGAAVLSLAVFMIWTANVNDRWHSRFDPAIRLLATPERSSALPDSGGVLYTDDRRVFFELFYYRPEVPWRHALSYSPELMPQDDYEVYAARVAGGLEALEPWARKLRVEDRLLVRDPRGVPPFPSLQWQHIANDLWSGRRRR